MSSEVSHGTGRGPSHRQVEIGVAIATGLFGLLVIFGSLQVGITWGVEGPHAGFFPFYIGLFIVVSSIVNLLGAMRTIPGRQAVRRMGTAALRSCRW